MIFSLYLEQSMIINTVCVDGKFDVKDSKYLAHHTLSVSSCESNIAVKLLKRKEVYFCAPTG